ncbi:MAG TPA: hypothetical protein GX505_11295 [Clostridiales bacterium]|nr:hypothetical protein [Clostridiales bacterium]
MDEINIKLPAKPEYMSVARLTTAAIANRAGFNIDDIEDLKVAVTEAGTYLINQYSSIPFITVDYRIQEDFSINIRVRIPEVSETEIKAKESDENKENELSLFIIESIVDKVHKDECNGVVRGFSILKTGGGNLNNE